jgi:hypothetical protein
MMFLLKRAIPAIAVAWLATFIGVGTGFVGSVPFVHPKTFQPYHLAFPPASIFAFWYIRHLWRKGKNVEETSFVMEMPPRHMAIMLGIFLIAGVALGIVLAQSSVQMHE